MSASENYRLSPRARWDLEAIWRYTNETWSRQQANDYYNQLLDSIEHLAEGRLHGPKIGNIRRGYLVLPVQSHFVVFSRRADILVVIRILHRRMNIVAHL